MERDCGFQSVLESEESENSKNEFSKWSKYGEKLLHTDSVGM